MTTKRRGFAAALLAAALLLGGNAAQAQVTSLPVRILPDSTGTGTIATTNTFQKIWTGSLSTAPGAPLLRSACRIQNQSTHTMWVYLDRQGTAGTTLGSSAMKTQGYALKAGTGAADGTGGEFTCNFGDLVDQSSIWITGTSGDAFLAVQW